MKNAVRRMSARGMATTVANRRLHTTGRTTAAKNPIPNDAHGLSLSIVATDWGNVGRKRSERSRRINVERKLTDTNRSHAKNTAGKSRGLFGGTFLTIFP